MKNLLKDLRIESGLSQLELSKKLGLSQSAIAKWEIGKAEPTSVALIKLSKFYNTSADYLLGLEDDFGNKTSETNNAHKAATSLTIDEREMLALWRELPQDKKNNFINLLKK